MKEIKLNSKKYDLSAMVDDEDFEYLNQWKWHPSKRGNIFYAYAVISKVPRKVMEMHRLLMNNPVGHVVDHKDGSGLNNQKYNLRTCSKGKNNLNRIVSSNNKTGFKGVHFQKDAGKYRAKIEIDKKIISLGYFDDARIAALAYNNAAIKYHGEFAKLNAV